MDGRRAITALISSLLVPHDDTRVCTACLLSEVELNKQDALLMLLFTIFKIKPPAWKDAFLEGKRLTGKSFATNLMAGAQVTDWASLQFTIERKKLSRPPYKRVSGKPKRQRPSI